MQRKIYYIAALFAATATALFTSCEPRAITEDDVFIKSTNVDSIIRLRDAEYHLYTLNEFVDTYMTEQGNFWSDTSQYRTRATNGDSIYLFSLDTLPTHGAGIYIRGRVTTDDYGGNFYKSLVIQQVIDGKQQNLRVSVDLGSVGGMYQLGQEILVRCNGLCIGRYGDQPQLCVPAYNNNIYAQNATQKVGWAPGRIPNAFFRNAVTMLGVPDQSKLQYDTITIADFINLNDEKQMRTMDGRLVVLKNVWFTGKYENQGTLTDCTTGDPETDSYANVFAPTTNNIGFPQSRVISDGTNETLVGSSEYSKFSHFYIPGANASGIADCVKYKGTITGILGQFRDNARYAHDKYDWSITPRNINIGNSNPLNDIVMFNTETGEEWIPKEYTAPKEKTTPAE